MPAGEIPLVLNRETAGVKIKGTDDADDGRSGAEDELIEERWYSGKLARGTEDASGKSGPQLGGTVATQRLPRLVARSVRRPEHTIGKPGI